MTAGTPNRPPPPQGQAEGDGETSEARARRMYDEDPLHYANEASDYGWSIITGMCGGCGREDCHDGPCVATGAFGKCGACSNRRAEGWF